MVPYIPVVTNPSDTSNFDIDDLKPSNEVTMNFSRINHDEFHVRSGRRSRISEAAFFTGHHLLFIGFTHSADR